MFTGIFLPFPQANKTLSVQTEEWTAMIDKQVVEEMEVYEKHSEVVSNTPFRIYISSSMLFLPWGP